jgi:hypothetical protein
MSICFGLNILGDSMLNAFGAAISHVHPDAQWALNPSGEMDRWDCPSHPELPTQAELDQWQAGYEDSLIEPDWIGFIAAFQAFSPDNFLYSDLAVCVGRAGWRATDCWGNLKALLVSQPPTRNARALADGMRLLLSMLTASGHPLPSRDIDRWNELINAHNFPLSCRLS